MKLLTVEYPEQYECTLTLTASAEELEAAANVIYERERHTITVKGFEKGAANRAEIEAYRGEHIFWYDAINDIMDADVPTILEEVIKKDDLFVVSDISYDLVKVAKDEGFTATARFALLPSFEIGEYRGIEVTATPTSVSDKDVEHYLERKQRLNANLVPHKGPAIKGDSVHVTYMGFIDEKPFEGSTESNAEVRIGNGHMIPGFDTAMIGHHAGDVFDYSCVFPGNYHIRPIAGKSAIYKVKVIDTCSKELPALNADFAKKIGNVDTIEEYRADVRKTIEDMRLTNARSQAKVFVLSKLNDIAIGMPPAISMQQAYEREINAMQETMQQQNISKEVYLRHMNKNEEEFEAQCRKNAEVGMRVNLTLLQIGIKEGFTPTKEQLDAEIERRATRAKKTPAEILARTDLRLLSQDLTRKAASDLVVENAKITFNPPGTNRMVVLE